MEGLEDRFDGPTADEAGFREWMSVRTASLRRKAFLMSGDWHSADDLVQDTLTVMYANWPRVARGTNVDGYANRVLVHKFIDDRRRPWRRERVVDVVPESLDEGAARAFAEVEGRDALLGAALDALPAGQRAVMVLRFTDDLSVAEIARLMDLPSGTVKSRLSRATEAIRAHLERHRHPIALATSTYRSTSIAEGAS
jgi:RNA polymerase sigma-70 factor (sigma-E family)